MASRTRKIQEKARAATLPLFEGMPANTVTIRKDPITVVTAPVMVVRHLTDPSMGFRPVMLGESAWFQQDGAMEFAREQSCCHPAPQRFAVYDQDNRWLASFQCGREMPAFVVVE